MNEERLDYLKDRLKQVESVSEFWANMPSNYQSLQFNELPNGLDSLARVTVEVRKPR